MAFITPPGAGSSSHSSTDQFQALSGLIDGGSTALMYALMATVAAIIIGLIKTALKRRPSDRPRRSHQFHPSWKRSTMGAQRSFAAAPTQPASDRPDHMALVAGADFRVVPLLNKSEAYLLPMLERIVREIGNGHRVMAQVSMGEIIRAANGFDSDANRAINAKRLDFIIIDRQGLTVAAIEYQGSGHHLSDSAFLRDAVKREALRKAGLSLIELPPQTDEALLRARLSEQTRLPLRRPEAKVTP